MFKRTGTLLFLILLILHCCFIYAGAETARVITKLLLVPCLIVYLWSSVSVSKRVVALPLTSLFFSFLGDLFLTQAGTTFFLAGMLAFMATHIINGVYFIRLQRVRSDRSGPALIALIIIGIAILLVFNLMKDNLGAFRIPIIVYMTLIGVMGVLAANLASNNVYRPVASRYIIPGALLFIVSDALLALDKFVWHDPAHWSIPVMATYGLAQLLLTRGYMAVTSRLS